MSGIVFFYFVAGSFLFAALAHVRQSWMLHTALACICTAFAIFGALHSIWPVVILNSAMLAFLLWKRVNLSGTAPTLSHS